MAARLLPAGDAGHLDAGQRLTMTLALVVPGLVLELVDPVLRSLGVLDQLAGDGEAGQLGRVGDERVAVDEQHRGQGDGVAGRADQLLDLDHVALGDPVLLAAGLDDRVHGTRTPVSVVLDGSPRRFLPSTAWPECALRARRPGARSTPRYKSTPS